MAQTENWQPLGGTEDAESKWRLSNQWRPTPPNDYQWLVDQISMDINPRKPWFIWERHIFGATLPCSAHIFVQRGMTLNWPRAVFCLVLLTLDPMKMGVSQKNSLHCAGSLPYNLLPEDSSQPHQLYINIIRAVSYHIYHVDPPRLSLGQHQCPWVRWSFPHWASPNSSARDWQSAPQIDLSRRRWNQVKPMAGAHTRNIQKQTIQTPVICGHHWPPPNITDTAWHNVSSLGARYCRSA